jgi:hypothetical protein
MTAWAYNPGGSAVSVAIGFNWTGGTQTFSVPPGIWTPLSVVAIAPVGTTSAYQVLGPTASGVTIDVTAAVGAGQVPGQLIAALSVTANQIAAHTITAAQIAANTITAAQIAANTITAAQIAAGTVVAGIVDATTITAATFKGTNWQADSNGTRWYSSTPAANNLTASESAVGYTDSFGNVVLPGSVVYSTGSGTCTYVQMNNGAIAVGQSGGSGQSGWTSNLSGLGSDTSGVLSYTNSKDGQMYKAGRTFIRAANNQQITATSAFTLSAYGSGLMQLNVVTGYVYHWTILLIVQPDQTGGSAQFQFGQGGTGGAVVQNANGYAMWTPTGNQSPGFQIYDGSLSGIAGSHGLTLGTDQLMTAEVWLNFSTAGIITLQMFCGTSGDTFHVRSCLFTQEVMVTYV